MCLLLIAHDAVPGYRLLVAANRDEYHGRPTAAAGHWDDRPGLFAGRDLESGGTWLGVHATGRFATVTNVRSGQAVRRGPRSRGLIVTDFLPAPHSAHEAAHALAADARDYDGFNLLAWDGANLVWYSNQAGAPRLLERGVYTLSNAALDTQWPKTARLRRGFERVMARTGHDPVEALLAVLRDDTRAADDDLPDTGVGLERERWLSSIFIDGGGAYGTRCSSVVTIDTRGHLLFHERRYDAEGAVSGDSRFELDLPAPAREALR